MRCSLGDFALNANLLAFSCCQEVARLLNGGGCRLQWLSCLRPEASDSDDTAEMSHSKGVHQEQTWLLGLHTAVKPAGLL